MIGRTNRFHGKASLRRMHSASKTVRGSLLALKYTSNQRRTAYRLAVVVSKKISKSAVVRNRIRRRLYEHVRILSSQFIGPYDLVLIVYDERLATMAAADIEQEVYRLCKKAQLLTSLDSSRDIVHTKEN